MQNQASGVRNAKPQEFRLSRRVAASFNYSMELTRASRWDHYVSGTLLRLARAAHPERSAE